MIPAEDLQCLKAIALRGGCKGPVFVSTQSIGTMLAISQQTASRRLKGLETQGSSPGPWPQTASTSP